MLSGKELGEAVAQAIERKGVSQQQVADEFEVRQSSVSEWTKYGRVAKKHIPHLVRYFADVAGPEHWGLPASWELSPIANEAGRMLDELPEDSQARLYALWAQVHHAVKSGLPVTVSIASEVPSQTKTRGAKSPKR